MQTRANSYSVAELCSWIQGRVANADRLKNLDEIRVRRWSDLGEARSGDLAFFFSPEYRTELARANPSILVTGPAFEKPLLDSGLPWLSQAAVVVAQDPYRAMAICSARFSNGWDAIERDPALTHVHPSAVVDPSAVLGPGCDIGPLVVIERGVRLGAQVRVGAHSTIGEGVSIGAGSHLFPSVTVYPNTILGERVRVHSGTVIGADGFGYAARVESGKPVGHEKIFHIGGVEIGDDVEIGAGATVDRGTLGVTRIGRSSKLDDQTHVGHNVTLGEGTIICGCTGLSGGASTGAYVLLGGGAGVSNKVHIAEGAKVGAFCFVSKDVKAGEVVAGNPQRSHSDFLKVNAILSKLLRDRGERKREA